MIEISLTLRQFHGYLHNKTIATVYNAKFLILGLVRKWKESHFLNFNVNCRNISTVSFNYFKTTSLTFYIKTLKGYVSLGLLFISLLNLTVNLVLNFWPFIYVSYLFIFVSETMWTPGKSQKWISTKVLSTA